ncbi:MAG: hypothetical protein GY714_18535 [Desulfobacterales bacterium]|nr:hypothetical protein [Desulfobacterales bacterium]
MELIHECYGEEGSELIINVDFVNFNLQVGYEQNDGAVLQKGIEGMYPCKSFDELNNVYQDIAHKLFQDEKYIDEYEDVEKPINLSLLHDIHVKTEEYPQFSWALYILKQILPKVKDKKLDNLVFYWSEEQTDGVFINNKGINGISEKELIQFIENDNWLNGTSVHVNIKGDQILDDFYELLENLDELIAQVDEEMYELCAVLESQKCFGLIETAEDFKAFNVWHDYDSVNFELRKKWNNKMKEVE